MKKRKYTYLWPLAMNLTLTGCSVAAPFAAPAGMTPVTGPAMGSAAATAPVTVALHRGAKSLVINLGGRYALQGASSTIAHKWVEADIYHYVLILEQKNDDDEFVAISPEPISLTVLRNAASTAIFAGLSAGEVYRVRLEAWGNIGGTAATSQLNTVTATISDDIDFTGENDIEQQRTVSLQATLDPVAFEGKATVTILPPMTGGFANPSSPTTTVSYSPTYSPSYTETYSPSYTPSYTDTYSPSYTASYTESYSPSYTASYTDSYSASYTASYTDSYSASYTTSYCDDPYSVSYCI